MVCDFFGGVIFKQRIKQYSLLLLFVFFFQTDASHQGEKLGVVVSTAISCNDILSRFNPRDYPQAIIGFYYLFKNPREILHILMGMDIYFYILIRQCLVHYWSNGHVRGILCSTLFINGVWSTSGLSKSLYRISYRHSIVCVFMVCTTDLLFDDCMCVYGLHDRLIIRRFAYFFNFLFLIQKWGYLHGHD